ncbi:zeta toxin family protein [Pseudomonas corrugata]|uniref:zeta toxin family protein n=1 Tax=Pseudomonas corrugata TaxID=47879 RepID=UPI0028C42E88|nr:zeta toxin family protein [Pseudomonas corrugata]MDU9025920.1 zeta toxin family protein [Pseudomonas corrugata]
MTQEEQAISERAVVFAKQNRTRIARDLACLETYSSDEYPVSVFMAGSPGAGKTEVSRAFIGMMCGFHGHPATYSMNIRPLIPR